MRKITFTKTQQSQYKYNDIATDSAVFVARNIVFQKLEHLQTKIDGNKYLFMFIPIKL